MKRDCPNCGADLIHDGRYCAHCGTELPTDKPDGLQHPDPTPKQLRAEGFFHKFTGSVIGLLVILLVIGTVARRTRAAKAEPGLPLSEGKMVFNGPLEHKKNVQIYQFDHRSQVTMVIHSTVGDGSALASETSVYTLTYDTSLGQVIHIKYERTNPSIRTKVFTVDQSSSDPMHQLSLRAQTEVYQKFYDLAKQQQRRGDVNPLSRD